LGEGFAQGSTRSGVSTQQHTAKSIRQHTASSTRRGKQHTAAHAALCAHGSTQQYAMRSNTSNQVFILLPGQLNASPCLCAAYLLCLPPCLHGHHHTIPRSVFFAHLHLAKDKQKQQDAWYLFSDQYEQPSRLSNSNLHFTPAGALPIALPCTTTIIP